MYKLSISTSGSFISACLHEEKLVGSLIFQSDQGSTNLLLNEVDEVEIDNLYIFNILLSLLFHQQSLYLKISTL